MHSCARDCVGADAFVRPPSEARIRQPMSSVSGERQRILLLVRTARSLRRPCCEVRPLRAQAQSVTDGSLTKAVHKTRGHSAPTEIQSVVKFTATSRRAYGTQAGVRAPNRDPGSLAATAVAARVFSPALHARRDSTRISRAHAPPSSCISAQGRRRAAVSPWKSGPLRAASGGPHESGL